MIRRLVWFFGILVMLASGWYTVVYLYRWEWNRALFTSILFVAVEVGLLFLMLLNRVQRVERSVRAGGRDRATLERLTTTRPTRNHFAWLETETSRLSVFVTVMLGAGVLLSFGTWIIDRLANRTLVPNLEGDLARRLDRAAFPTAPLVPDDEELIAQGGPYGTDHLDLLLGPKP